MAHASWPLGRHPPNPSPANSRPAPARRPDAPPRAAQGTACPTCGERSDSGKMTRCQCKQAPEHAWNKVHHANDALLKTMGISRLDSSHKYRMHRSSGGGGTYSKPDARVKLIPAEDITYVRHGKLFGRTVGSAGSQKWHCRRSVTPPPSSRKVSLVGSISLNQKPTPPASPIASCLSPKRLETAENGYSLVGDYITSYLTTQTASLVGNRPSPSCKAVLSQPSVPSMVNDATVSKNLSRMDSREAFVRSCSSSVLHCQVQSSAIPPAGLLKEAVINPISSSSVHVLAAHSSESPLGSKAEPSSKHICTPDNGKLCSTAPFVQKEPTMKPTLLSSTSVLSERSTEVHQDTRSRPSSRLNLFDGKCNLASLQCKTTIPPTQSPQSTSPAQCVELSNDFEAVPSTKNPISNEEQTNQEASINCNISSGTPVILHTKLHKKHYQPEACWKGKFEVIGKLTHTCDELEAHFPFEIFIKVYEASKQMPEILKLEALPLSRLWPKMFKMKPPDGQDIGLCFISALQRSNRNFDYLLENTSSHIGLRAYIGTMELLIFSSKLLTQDNQTKSGKFYFWGVFRKHPRKKQHRSNNQTNNVISDASLSNRDSSGRSEDIGMNLDLTEGKEAKRDKCEIGTKLDTTGGEEMVKDISKEIGKILDVTGVKAAEKVNKCLAMLGTPDSNAAASCAAPAAASVSVCCSPDSVDSPCQSATRTPAGSDLVLDTPPGFLLDVPPGFTKAHCLLRTGETTESYIDSFPSLVLDTPPGFPLDVPPGFTKAHCRLHAGETAESCVDSFPSLGLDTPPGFPLDIPPGFTEAHRRLPTITSAGAEAGVSTPVCEKKPLIKFSLNVTRPVQTEVPPGFTRLLAVKKEPGLPVVYNATEKITPIGKVDEMKIKQKVKVEVEESSEEREFPKTRLLSDILGFSPPSNENTSTLSKCTPIKCTEACRSAPVPVANNFQEMGAPEKQTHRRKRGQQESSEPSAADTTKRLKVNGCIALKKCAVRQALNSNNQEQGNDKLRRNCTSSSGPMAHTKDPRSSLPTSSGDIHGLQLRSESTTCTCVVCGQEFPTQ